MCHKFKPFCFSCCLSGFGLALFNRPFPGDNGRKKTRCPLRNFCLVDQDIRANGVLPPDEPPADGQKNSRPVYIDDTANSTTAIPFTKAADKNTVIKNPHGKNIVRYQKNTGDRILENGKNTPADFIASRNVFLLRVSFPAAGGTTCRYHGG